MTFKFGDILMPIDPVMTQNVVIMFIAEEKIDDWTPKYFYAVGITKGGSDGIIRKLTIGLWKLDGA